MTRITKNWRTTALGLTVLGVVFLLVYLGKATLTESYPFFLIGLGLLFSKDELFIKNFLPFLKSKLPNDNNEPTT